MFGKGLRGLWLLTAGLISTGCSNPSTSYFYGTRPNGDRYAYAISDINGDEKPDLLGIVSGKIPSSDEEFSNLLEGNKGIGYFTSKFNPEITLLGTSKLGERYMHSPAYREKVDGLIGENVPIYLMPEQVESKFREGLSAEDFRTYPIQAKDWTALKRFYK